MSGLPYHNGPHPAYNSEIERRLSDTYENLADTYGNFDSVPASEARSALESIIEGVRDTIASAGVELQ